MTTIIKIFISIFFLSLGMENHNDSSVIVNRMKGITMVAPPSEFPQDPIKPIQSVNANYIALVPYGFSRQGETDIRFNEKWQWWGETPNGIIESIKRAHDQGVKVMLKPQVYIPGSWVGYVDFDSEEEWLKWEDSYRNYIETFLDIAIKYDVEVFCIGTEYKIAVKKREKFWRKLIKDARLTYPGIITYSSNWDGFKKVPFWDVLDMVGLSAYFPLTQMKTPTMNILKKEWKPIVQSLKKFSAKVDKDIVFTEYGYLSVDGCAHEAWNLEKRVKNLPINELAQANAYAALLATFGKEKFWRGGFLWKWFPNMQGHEGYPEKDYTPQGKLAEEVIREYYNKI